MPTLRTASAAVKPITVEGDKLTPPPPPDLDMLDMCKHTVAGLDFPWPAVQMEDAKSLLTARSCRKKKKIISHLHAEEMQKEQEA